MITDSFDLTTEAIISPEKFYGRSGASCDVCIVTFSLDVAAEIRNRFACGKIAEISCPNGVIACYRLTYKGKNIAFYVTLIGSAGAGVCIEEISCLTGASKFIMFGSCGCLDRDAVKGKMIVPTDAYRDEGLSYHYAKASDYIRVKNSPVVADYFKEAGIPYITGKTWTTDAIYRETRGNMEKRKAQGCIAVEMECAGVQAVCDFRHLELYYFLIGCDVLDTPEWDRSILGAAAEQTFQLKCFYLALDLALRIS